MKPERFKRTKSVVASSAIALVVAALVMGLSSLVIGPRAASPQRLGFELTSGGPCTTTSVSPPPPSFAVCGPAVGHGPVLYPGAPESGNLPLNFYNPLSVGISVYSLKVTFTNEFPTNCDPTAFKVNGTALAGTPPSVTLNFPSGSYIPVSGNSATSPGGTYNATLALADKGNQDACKNLTLSMAYMAMAQYTDNTTTVLTSAPNPSALGSSVTFTATVTASNSGSDTSQPSGTVSFYKCTSATVCPNTSGNLLGTGTIGAGGKATYPTTSGQLAQGLNYIDAVYPTSGTNFTGSTSNVVTQDVGAGTTTALTSAPNPSTSGQSVTFTATVTKTSGTGMPTGTVTFYKGTPMTGTALGAPVTLNPTTGKAALSYSALAVGTDHVYAVYSGDNNFSTSTSPVLNQVVTSAACITGTINGGYTVPSNQFICITGRVNGGITVKSGSGLYLNGATVNGGITSTGATGLTSCASTINGNITISGSTGPVLIGDGGDNQPTGDDPLPACAGNTINGSVSLTNNTGGVEFGGNTVTGSVSMTNNTNTAGPEVEANKITGNLGCSSNVAAPTDDGLKNTVTGTKSGQCAGSAF